MRKILKITSFLLFLAIAVLLPISTAHAAVNVTVDNNASRGTVTGPGINCGSDCSEPLEAGTTIALTVTAAPGWIMTEGPGSCPYNSVGYSGTVNCDVTITNTTSQSLVFSWSYASYTITATTQGTGSGTVSGLGTYPFGTVVTLTATPSAGSVFSGWQTSGDICYSGGKGSSSVNPSPTCTTYAGGSAMSTFTAVARFDKTSSSTSQAPASSTLNSSSTPPSTSPTPTTPTKPSVPSLEGVRVDGNTVKATDKISVTSDKPLVLSGKTVPNGTVTLYVFSEPKKYTVQADGNGNWTYTVKGLPAGNHHAEVEVTDPTTHQTSDRAKLIEFTVLAAQQTASQQAAVQTNAKKNPVGGWIIIALIVAATGGGIYFVLWKRKHAKSSVPSDPTPPFPPTIGG